MIPMTNATRTITYNLDKLLPLFDNNEDELVRLIKSLNMSFQLLTNSLKNLIV
jgi:hypothetical protein